MVIIQIANKMKREWLTLAHFMGDKITTEKIESERAGDREKTQTNRPTIIFIFIVSEATFHYDVPDSIAIHFFPFFADNFKLSILW